MCYYHEAVVPFKSLPDICGGAIDISGKICQDDSEGLLLILLINRSTRCQAPIESEKVLVMALWLHSAAPTQCLVRSQDSRIG